MKGRDKEVLRAMTVPELQARLKEAEEARFRLQFRHTSNPLKNPMQIRAKRREIALLKTSDRPSPGIGYKNIELRQLRSFALAASEGNFSAVATALGSIQFTFAKGRPLT